jgi:thiol-disulfide isomerase/thioredoxin
MDELNEAIEAHSRVVVDFAAPSWCIPCQRLAPHYEAVSEKMGDTLFVHVDIDKADKDVVDYYKVQGVPYVIAYLDTELVGVVTSRTAPKLIQELNTLFKE